MPNNLYVARGSTLRALGSWPDLAAGVAPPASTEVMLLGASGPWASGVNPALSVAGKKYAVRRGYDQTALPASYAGTASAGDFAAGRSSVWSCAPDMAAFTAGTLDVAFTSLLLSVPQGTLPNGRQYRFYCCLWHEPDVKIKAGLYTAAQFKAASQRMCDLIVATGRTNIVPTLITTQQPFFPAQPFAPADFYDASRHKMWMVDGYNQWGYSKTATTSNHYNGKKWTEMTERFSSAVAYFLANNVPWGIGETNATEDYNTSAADPGGLHSKSSWLTAGLRYCYDSGARVFCFWDNDFSSDFNPVARRLDSSAAFMATWDAALATYGSA